MSLLNNLNESQREAGKTINGPLLILAGAGSGKTRTITYRIAHMVQEMGISPYHILAVTFTNKAAKEMRERVHNLIGHEAEKIVVSTFHSFGMKMLRMYANFLGYESNFNIYDTDDQTKVVRNILKELGATVQETPKKIVSLISKLKEDGVSPEDYEKTVPSFLENYKVIIETYKKYKKVTILITSSSAKFLKDAETYLKNIGKYDENFKSIELTVEFVGDFKVKVNQK